MDKIPFASDACASAIPVPMTEKLKRQRIIAQRMVDFLVETIGQEQFDSIPSVMELGCSTTGFLPYYMIGKKAYGVDLHKKFAAYWTQLGVKYLVSDGRTIPMLDKSVRLVVSHSVVEHIPDLPQTLREIDRVLKPGGIAYVTSSPLYYSPRGHHKHELPDWEHLNPESPHFMMRHPIERIGSSLNRLTVTQFMGMIGTLPWNIEKMDRKVVPAIIPDWLDGAYPQLDLLTSGFRLVARKA